MGKRGTNNNSWANPLKEMVRKSRASLWSVGLFSCAVNLLMLTSPLFMLQVYDRVLASRSVPTLVALFGLVAALYLFLGLFDLIRNKTMSRMGYRMDVELMALVKRVWISAGLQQARVKARPITDLSIIRQFLSSNGLPALFDLPWVPVYLAIVYLLHAWLGLLATAGAFIVIAATVINELITKKSIGEASEWDLRDAQFADSTNRNAEAIVAMGMTERVTNFWKNLRQNSLSHSQRASSRSEFVAALTKAVRMLVQSGILALGAYLAIYQEITPGTMIAASILAGRAVAPVDTAIGNWKNFIRVRQAYYRLSALLESHQERQSTVKLPEPSGHINLSNVTKLPKRNDGQLGDIRPILQGINFEIKPGDGLGVIGPSASGKSSLARLLVGLWTPDKGTVRFAGATFNQWDRNEVGKYVGYLPQSVELLEGTIRQNIARFDDDASDEAVVAAAQMARVHELILGFPDGYSTEIGSCGVLLSGGQAQRIALARAVFGRPPLIVLDEPNSNLDSEGDEALTAAINELRLCGSCVIVMAHRPSAIAAVNKVLMLNNGKQLEFGSRDEVLRKVTRTVPSPVLNQFQKAGM